MGELSPEGEGLWVVGVDHAIAEITDDREPPKMPKFAGANATPQGVSSAPGDSSGDEGASGIVDANDAVSLSKKREEVQ